MADIDDQKIDSAMDNVSVGELKQLGRKAFMGGSTGRAQLLDAIKDHAINFLLDALPKIKVPPIEGERNATPIAGAPPIGIKYRVWDIDLSQLQIDKRHVQVSFGGSTDQSSSALATEGVDVLVISIDDVVATIPTLKWSFEQTTFPYVRGEGVAKADATGGNIRLGFQLACMSASDCARASDCPNGVMMCKNLQDTSVAAAGDSAKGVEYYLVVGSNTIELGELVLEFDGSWLSSVYNYVAYWFQEEIGRLITILLRQLVETHIGKLLSVLNRILRPHWPRLLPLLAGSERHAPRESRRVEYTVEFSADPSLRFAVAGGRIVVSSFAEATSVAETAGIVGIGDVLVAVNGQVITGSSAASLLGALKPLPFKRAAKLIMQQKAESAKDGKPFCLRFRRADGTGVDFPFDACLPLGIKFAPAPKVADPTASRVVVKGFSRKGLAELGGHVRVGDALVAVKDILIPVPVTSATVADRLVGKVGVPFTLRFSRIVEQQEVELEAVCDDA